MPAILGIDAAWTVTNPSGIALVHYVNGVWRCIQLAPNAQSFIEAAFGPRQWPATYTMIWLVSEVLAAAEALAHEQISVVALDLPLSRQRITGRRSADDETSRVCGRYGCPTHSPTPTRPGALGEAYFDALSDSMFSLYTNEREARPDRCAIEVYPHPAIVALLHAHERLRYKVGKTSKYWPGVARTGRWRLILGVLGQILAHLQEEIPNIQMELPSPDELGTFTSLKPFEDMLDALVCAWVGMQHLMGRARPLGDNDAAIWLPDSPLFFPARNGDHQLQ